MSFTSAKSFVIVLSFIGFGLISNTSFAQESDQDISSSGCISYNFDEDNGKNVIIPINIIT